MLVRQDGERESHVMAVAVLGLGKVSKSPDAW